MSLPFFDSSGPVAERSKQQGRHFETDATLTIRESKFGKSRVVPMQPSVLAALQRYARLRDEAHRQPTTVSFFVSTRRNGMVYPTIHAVFRNLCDSAGIGADAVARPRIHDLRH